MINHRVPSMILGSARQEGSVLRDITTTTSAAFFISDCETQQVLTPSVVLLPSAAWRTFEIRYPSHQYSIKSHCTSLDTDRKVCWSEFRHVEVKQAAAMQTST